MFLACGNAAAKARIAMITGASDSDSESPPANHGSDSSDSVAAHFAEFLELSTDMVLPPSEQALVNSIFAVGLADVLYSLKDNRRAVQFKGYDACNLKLFEDPCICQCPGNFG